MRPVRRLRAGAEEISAGDYDVTIPVTSRDEIGDLTAAFNEMSRNLEIKEGLLTEQRKENNRLLLSLMPESVVQRYRDGEQTISQEHQDVTIIFADIVGLDEISTELSGDESIGIVDELIREFDAAAETLGVERIRTVHNGYLASCGVSVPAVGQHSPNHRLRPRDAAHHRAVQRPAPATTSAFGPGSTPAT